MENNISTNVVKLDLKTIMKNYRDPKFWAKKWTILDCKWLKAVWFIDNIDCKNGKIYTRVDVTTKSFTKGSKTFSSHYDWNTCAALSIEERENSETVFNNTVFNTMMRGIRYCECTCISEYASYKDAMNCEIEAANMARDIAIKFLDEHNITEKSVRDSYIEAYIKQHSKSGVYTYKIIEQYQKRVLTDAYIFAYVWFNRTDDVEYEELLKVIETKQNDRVLEEIKQEVADMKASMNGTMKGGE